MTDETELTTAVMEALHASPDGFRHVVRDMAARYPQRPARALEGALRGAADALDGHLTRQGRSTHEARAARRLALLLGLDIDRLEQGGEAPTLGALAEWWRQEDDFWLRL